MTPDIFNSVQHVFVKSSAGKSDLPTVMCVHDNTSRLPFSYVLKNLSDPVRVCLPTNYRSVINISCNN